MIKLTDEKTELVLITEEGTRAISKSINRYRVSFQWHLGYAPGKSTMASPSLTKMRSNIGWSKYIHTCLLREC